MPKAIAFVCAGLTICSLQPGRAQVLTTDPNAPGAARDTSGTLAGPARGLHPSMAAHLTSPAIMDADESISALPLKVMFEPGSARLTASATRALDHLGQSLSAGPLADERVRIEGHADAGGTRDAKRDIAERRAMAVAAYLEQNFGINPNRVECTGQGAAPPSQRVVLIVALTSG